MTKIPKIACFFATSGHSGVDRAMNHLIPAMVRRGYPVDLLHVQKHGPYIKNPPEGLNIVDLGSKHVYPSLPAVVRYLKRERPHVMLSDKDRVNRTAIFAKMLAGVDTRLVLRSGTTISVDLASRKRFDRWLQKNSMGKLYRYADQVIVPSQGAADDLAEYTGLNREMIAAVPSPIVPEANFTRQYPRPEHPWFAEGEPPVIISVGELSPRKDFATLLRAFAKVRVQTPCRLVILGKGGQKQALLALAQELGVATDFDLPGFQPNPYDFLAHASLFAFSSRWEGLPLALVEALAAGTPVVSTDCPSGPREVLQDGQYGNLIPVGDDDQMAQAIMETLRQPLPAETLKQAVRRFEIEASASAYLAALGLPPYADIESAG